MQRFEALDRGLDRTDCVRVAGRSQQSTDLGVLQQPERDCDVVILDVLKVGTSGEQPTSPEFSRGEVRRARTPNESGLGCRLALAALARLRVPQAEQRE